LEGREAVTVTIRRVRLSLEGLPMSPARARAVAERALATAAEGLEGGAGGRVLQLTVAVRPDRTDDAALADTIGQAIRTAIQDRVEGGGAG
jgi:hypothetical protein